MKEASLLATMMSIVTALITMFTFLNFGDNNMLRSISNKNYEILLLILYLVFLVFIVELLVFVLIAKKKNNSKIQNKNKDNDKDLN